MSFEVMRRVGRPEYHHITSRCFADTSSVYHSV